MDHHPNLKEWVRDIISEGRIIWEDFVWMGSSHFVLPALYSAFRRNGILPLLPEDLAEHLGHIHSLNFKRNLEILAQCKEINNRLSHSGIEVLFLKGAGLLLSGLYAGTGDRLMEDIDMLVRGKDIAKVSEVLAESGYLPVENGSVEEDYLEHHHLPPLRNSRYPAVLELHRLPVHFGYRNLVSVEEMFLQQAFAGNTEYRIPSLAVRQQLVFLHEHRWAEGSLRSLGSLKGHYNFYLLSKLSPPDLQLFPHKRFRKRFQQFCYYAGKISGFPDRYGITETAGLKRWWRWELFLLDHPGVDLFWHGYFYAPAYLGGLLIKSVFSKKSRKLFLLKLKKSMTG